MTASSRHKRKTSSPLSSAPRARDGEVYFGFLMIGTFIVLLSVPLTSGELWRHILIGYLGALAMLVNLYAYRAYAGRKLLPWQQSLARLPLRWAGYGRKGSRPIEAAHDKREVLTAIMVSVIVCIVLLFGLTAWLAPGIAS